METSISLQLNKKLKSRIEKRAKDLDTNTNDLIIMALENYFYFEKVDKLRTELNKYATLRGYKSEEDIYREIS